MTLKPEKEKLERLKAERDQAADELTGDVKGFPETKLGKDVIELVREHPFASAGAAAAVGFLASSLITGSLVRNVVQTGVVLGFRHYFPKALEGFEAAGQEPPE